MINLATAKALGLTVPPRRADEKVVLVGGVAAELLLERDQQTFEALSALQTLLTVNPRCVAE